MDEAAKKAILRSFPYGLYVVTVTHNGEDHGMTANWITQAAFEPPMVVVAIENTSKTIGMIRDSHHFAINLLLKGQRDLAGKLGRSSDQSPQKLKGIKTKPAPVSGVPVLGETGMPAGINRAGLTDPGGLVAAHPTGSRAGDAAR